MPNQIQVRVRGDRNEITTFRRCRPDRRVIQGDSAIPGSRATGATTSTRARDCDQPIDNRKGLPSVEMLIEAAKQVRRSEARVTMKPHTSRPRKQHEDQNGIRGERGGGSVTLLGKRAIRRRERGWMFTINTHGVDFSLSGCVEEMVRDPNPMTFFFFLFFFLFHVLCFICHLGTKTTCSASYGKEKPP